MEYAPGTPNTIQTNGYQHLFPNRVVQKGVFKIQHANNKDNNRTMLCFASLMWSCDNVPEKNILHTNTVQ
eukprot:3776244-Amphidinium_carterae.1